MPDAQETEPTELEGPKEDESKPRDGGAADKVSQDATRPAHGWTADLREIIASVIATTIAVLSVWMLYSVFQRGGEVKTGLSGKPELQLHDTAYNRQKDIMLYGLTLLGTVLGYYFGRVPAERRAEQAEVAVSEAQAATTEAASAANEAQRHRQAAEVKVADSRKTLARVKKLRLSTAPQRRTLGSGAATAAEPAASKADAEIDALADRLG